MTPQPDNAIARPIKLTLGILSRAENIPPQKIIIPKIKTPTLINLAVLFRFISNFF